MTGPSNHTLVMLLWSGTLCIASCSTPNASPVEEPAPVEAEVAQPVRTDPGPQLERNLGTQDSVLRPPLSLPATAGLATGEHYYLRVDFDGGLHPNDLYDQAGHVESPRHAVAFLTPDGAYVRFVGNEAPTEGFTLHLFGIEYDQQGKTDPDSRKNVHQAIAITHVAAAGDDPGLPGIFWSAMSSYFDAYSPGVPLFHTYVRHRASLAMDRPTPAPNQRRSDLGSLMATYTGVLSVEEALQIDRALLLRAAPVAERTVELASLESIGLPEHPWEQMIAELEVSPVIEPLAKVVPADMLYLHFDDLRTFVKLAADLDQWVTPLVQAMEGKGGSSHFTERYETQLAIERTGLSRELGHLAAKSVALATSDPFLREGTDVSLLFHVGDARILNSALKRYEDATRARFPDLSQGSYALGAHKVRTLTTPDGRIGQHRLELGEVLILSNSRRALEKFVAVHQGEATSLQESGDFQYMRTRYPHDPEVEDGFVFIGDAFVTKVVNPEVKILSARRMEARADLVHVNNAALLFGWLEGRRPLSAKELVDHDLLRPQDLVHAEGDPISFDPRQGASSAWGRAAAMKPLLELDLDKVTPDEAQAYARFRAEYLGQWQTFIDPIAARISYEDEGRKISIDARMLPLIQNSEYDSLQEQVGERTTTPPTFDGAFQWTLAVGDDAGLRRELNMMARQMSGSRDIGLDWLGDWVMVGAADRSGLYDLAIALGLIPEAGRAMGLDAEVLIELATRIPLYFGAHVKNSLGLAATLTALRSFIEGAAPGLVFWDSSQIYGDIPITSIRGTGAFSHIALHYAVANEVVAFSLERETLETIIDAALAGELSGSGDTTSSEPLQTMLTLRPSPGQSWMMTALEGMLEKSAEQGFHSARQHYRVLAHGLPDLPEDARDARDEAVAILGIAPRDPHQGVFSLDAHGQVQHSIYTHEARTIYPALPIEGSPVTAILKTLLGLELQLGFEGEDEHRGLRTRIVWERGE